MAARRRKSKKRSAASSPSTAPPEPLNFFVDECVAHRHVARVLNAAGYVTITQSETFGTGAQDVDWLPHVGQAGWILITKDKNIRKRPLELRALQRSGVRAFVLTSGSLSGEDQARVFGEALPAMLRLIRRQAAPFIARVTAEGSVQIIPIGKYIGDDQ